MTVADFRQLAINYFEEKAKPNEDGDLDIGLRSGPYVDSLIDVSRFKVGAPIPDAFPSDVIWAVVAVVTAIAVAVVVTVVVVKRKKTTES